LYQYDYDYHYDLDCHHDDNHVRNDNHKDNHFNFVNISMNINMVLPLRCI